MQQGNGAVHPTDSNSEPTRKVSLIVTEPDVVLRTDTIVYNCPLGFAHYHGSIVFLFDNKEAGEITHLFSIQSPPLPTEEAAKDWTDRRGAAVNQLMEGC